MVEETPGFFMESIERLVELTKAGEMRSGIAAKRHIADGSSAMRATPSEIEQSGDSLRAPTAAELCGDLECGLQSFNAHRRDAPAL